MNKKGVENIIIYVLIILIILAISIYIIYNVLSGQGGIFSRL